MATSGRAGVRSHSRRPSGSAGNLPARSSKKGDPARWARASAIIGAGLSLAVLSGPLATVLGSPASAVGPTYCAGIFDTSGLASCVTPPGLTTLGYVVEGGSGGDSRGGAAVGGLGARISGTLTVTPGDTLYLTVGANGTSLGGDNGGNGGAYSAIATGGHNAAGTPVVIAGAGGGAGTLNANSYRGGNGGIASTGGGGGAGGFISNGGNGGITSAGGTARVGNTGGATGQDGGNAGVGGAGGGGGGAGYGGLGGLGYGEALGNGAGGGGRSGVAGQATPPHNQVAGAGGSGWGGGGGGQIGAGGGGSSLIPAGATAVVGNRTPRVAFSPYASGVTPTSAPPNSSITVTGAGFIGATAVTIGGTSVTYTILSNTSITFTIPSSTSSGTKDIVVSNAVGESSLAGALTVTAPPPPPPAPSGGGSSGESESASPEPSASPSASASSSVAPSAPSRLEPVVPGSSAGLPAGGLPAGGSVLLVNGLPVPLTVEPNAPSDPVALVFTGPGLNMRLEGRGDANDPLGLTSKQALILQSEPGGTSTSGAAAGSVQARSAALGPVLLGKARVKPVARTSGDGFAPGTPVKLFLLSVGYLGEVTTDAAGSFAGAVPIPPGIKPGVYTLQANGFAPDFSVRSLSIGVLVKPTSVRTATARAKVYFEVLSPVLDAQAKATLRTIARKATSGPGAVRSVVVGYVQPTNASGNDQSLSSARAKAVATYLRSLGVKGVYVVRGDGKAEEAGATARRVNIAITYRR